MESGTIDVNSRMWNDKVNIITILPINRTVGEYDSTNTGWDSDGGKPVYP